MFQRVLCSLLTVEDAENRRRDELVTTPAAPVLPVLHVLDGVRQW